MAQTATLTNCTIAQKSLLAHKQVAGFHAYESNTTAGTYLYPILRNDNTCVVDSIAGYTKRYEAISNDESILFCENNIFNAALKLNCNPKFLQKNWYAKKVVDLNNVEIGIKNLVGYFQSPIGDREQQIINYINI